MKNILLVLMLLAVSLPAWADEKIVIKEVVVSASRVEEEHSETTSDVTVIRNAEIKKMNVIFIPDILRKIPELSVVQSGGDGQVTSVFLRGGGSQHTLILIDGFKVNSNTAGGFDFSGIVTEDIERIEIIKGAQSTIYGSEAMAGVINIITKRGEGKLKTELLLTAGSFGTYNPSVTVSGSEKSFSYRVTALHYKTEGISAAKSGTEKDGHKNSGVSWNFGLRPSDRVEFEVSGNYSNDRSHLDDWDFFSGSAIDSLTLVRTGKHSLISGRTKFYVSDKWEQIISVSDFTETLKVSDSAVSWNNYEIKNKRDTVDWQHNLYLTNGITLTGGFEFKEETGESVGSYKESVDTKAVYFNSKFKLLNDRLILNAGVRYDDHESFGSDTTYKLGAAYTIKEMDTTIRASYGTGFRAPSFNDLFWPGYGNPNLKSEESTSFEIGVMKNFAKEGVSVSLTWFKQDYENLIQADPFTWTAANIAKAKTAGIEAAMSVKVFQGLDLKMGYTYLDTEDEATGDSLARRPRNKFVAGLGYAIKDISLVADVIYIGNRYDSATDASIGKKLSTYTLVNLSGAYRISRNITAIARVENLFNEKYEETRGYGTKGFSINGGLRITL